MIKSSLYLVALQIKWTPLNLGFMTPFHLSFLLSPFSNCSFLCHINFLANLNWLYCAHTLTCVLSLSVPIGIDRSLALDFLFLLPHGCLLPLMLISLSLSPTNINKKFTHLLPAQWCIFWLPIWKFFLLTLNVYSTLYITLLWHLHFPPWIVNIFISESEVLRGWSMYNQPTFPLTHNVYHSAMWMINKCFWVKEILL